MIQCVFAGGVMGDSRDGFNSGCDLDAIQEEVVEQTKLGSDLYISIVYVCMLYGCMGCRY